MNTTRYFLLIILIFFIAFCTDEDPIKKRELRIKRVLTYHVITDEIPYMVQEYQYDSYNRLEKITVGDWSYDTFHYKDNLLEYKNTYNFANNEIGWDLVDSIYYQYVNGKLVSEIINGGTIIKYIYDNSKLVRKKLYVGQQFYNSRFYEYSGDLCTKETLFSDSLDLRIINYTIHYYENKKLILSELFLKNGTQFRSMSYKYNDKGSLVNEEAKQLWELPNSVNYVKYFEYE